MAEMAFSAKNKSKSVFSTDLLKGLEKDEKTRICIIDKNVSWVFAHSVTTVGDDGKRKFRYYKCLGDLEVVNTDGKDPKNCPACAVATNGEDAAVKMPRRRFVVYILRYTTNTRGELILDSNKRCSFRLQGWIFTDKTYDRIADMAEEFGDMRHHDIVVTCDHKQYQNYTFMPLPNARWESEKRTPDVNELLKERSKEVELLLGTELSVDKLESLIGEALPTIGRSDAPREVRAKAAVDSAFDALETAAADPDAETVLSGEGEEDDIVMARNDRGPVAAAVGTAAKAPDDTAGEVNIDDLIN